MAWAAVGLGLAWLFWRWLTHWRPIRGRGWGGPSSADELARDNSYLPPEILYMPMTDADFEQLAKGKKVYFNKEHK
jgi:hypothetical protein